MTGFFGFIPTFALTAQTAQPGDTAALLSSLIPFGIVILFFYFFLIRPQRKKEKQENEMRRNLEVGDDVITRGGIVGRVCNIKDDLITIESGANKVRITVQRWAIGAKETKISD